MLTITTHFTSKDTLAIGKILCRIRPRKQKCHALIFFLLFGLVIGITSHFWMKKYKTIQSFIDFYNYDGYFDNVQYALYGFAVLTIILLYGIILGIPAHYRRRINAYNRDLEKHVFTYTIDEQGLCYETDNTDKSWFSWKNIRCVVEKNGYLIFIIENTVGIPIPLRCFPDNETAQHFIQTAKAYHQAGNAV